MQFYLLKFMKLKHQKDIHHKTKKMLILLNSINQPKIYKEFHIKFKVLHIELFLKLIIIFNLG